MRVIDRGPTRGHRYLVMDGAKRVAVFDKEVDADMYVADNHESVKYSKSKKPKES